MCYKNYIIGNSFQTQFNGISLICAPSVSLKDFHSQTHSHVHF